MDKIMIQVSNIIMKSSSSSEEAIDHFLKSIISEIALLSHIGPKQILSKVFPFKQRVLQTRLDESERLLRAYNSFLTKKELEWVELARHWHIPKTLQALEHLKNRTKNFELLASSKFEDFRKNIERHNESLIFIKDNYDVSQTDLTKINRMQKKLDKMSNLTYLSFVKEITS